MSGPAPPPSELAASLAAVPGLAGRLVERHVDAGDGRCRECTRADQGGPERWPCRIRSYADAALRLQDVGRRGPRAVGGSAGSGQ